MENKLSKKTLATQVKELIFEKIENRGFDESGQLPNESLLAEMYGVSRITIRDALASLEQDGYITRFPGKGTFANYGAAQIKSRISTSYNFFNLIKNNGFEPTAKLIDTVKEPMSDRLQKMLKLPEKEDVYIRKLVFLADGKPAVYCENYIGEHYVDESFLEIEPMGDNSFFEIMRNKYNFPKVTYDIASIIPIVLGKWLADMFESTQYAPGLLIESMAYDSEHNPIFLSKEFYNTDMIKFNDVRMIEY